MGGKGGGKGRAAPQCKFLDPLLQRLVCATALRRLLRTFLVNGNSVTPPSVADPEIQNPEWEFGYASISGGSRNSESRMGIRLRLHQWWIQKFKIQNGNSVTPPSLVDPEIQNPECQQRSYFIANARNDPHTFYTGKGRLTDKFYESPGGVGQGGKG